MFYSNHFSIDFWLPGGGIPADNTELTFSIGNLTNTDTYTINPGNATHLDAFLITQWVSINSLDVQVALQARDDEDQTNINPVTVSVYVYQGSTDSVMASCTVAVPSGICSVSVPVPLTWLSGITSDIADAFSVSADFPGSAGPVSLGSVNARFEQTCSLVNSVLINAPTYTQFTGSLVTVPVLASAQEGVNGFSLEFMFSPGLEFVRIDGAEYFGFSYISDSNRHYVTGSTNRLPIPTGTMDHLFTIVLRVTANLCSGQTLVADVIYLSDGKQQIVSSCFVVVYIFVYFYCIYFQYF